MSNKAVITAPKRDLALYLHWNGGIDTIEPLLKYCELQGYIPPSVSNDGWTRMAQVLGNFFGGAKSLSIDHFKNLDDQGDNGVYIIEGWKIADHIYRNPLEKRRIGGWQSVSPECEQRIYDFDEMLHKLDAAMPEQLRLGGFLDSVEVPVDEVKLGDIVWMRSVFGTVWEPYPVIGFGEGKRNGEDVTGVPFVKQFDHDGDYSWNINNYVRGDVAHIKPRK